MKRVITATCLAAMCAAGLAAQETTGTPRGQGAMAAGQRAGGPRTVTGCLRAGDTAASYLLTDVIMQGGRGRRGGDAASTGSSTSTGTSTTTGTSTSTAQGGRGMMAPQTIMLSAASDVDLKAHVGHKVEVTGTLAGGRGRAAGDATTSGGTATSTGTSTGTSTSTGTTTSTTSAQGPRSMTVTSVRMVSDTCS